jgi:hypothetical protein
MKKTLSILLVAALVAAISTSVGCNKVYNINGVWFFTIFIEGDVVEIIYDFIGSRESGEVIYEGQSLGTYTVIGNEVNITLQYYDEDNDYTIETYSGGFDDRQHMSGNFTIFIEGYGTFAGTWDASR